MNFQAGELKHASCALHELLSLLLMALKRQCTAPPPVQLWTVGSSRRLSSFRFLSPLSIFCPVVLQAFFLSPNLTNLRKPHTLKHVAAILTGISPVVNRLPDFCPWSSYFERCFVDAHALWVLMTHRGLFSCTVSSFVIMHLTVCLQLRS